MPKTKKQKHEDQPENHEKNAKEGYIFWRENILKRVLLQQSVT